MRDGPQRRAKSPGLVLWSPPLLGVEPIVSMGSSFSWFNQFQGNPQKRNYDDGDDHSTLISRVLNPYGNLVDPVTDPFLYPYRVVTDSGREGAMIVRTTLNPKPLKT